MKKARLFLIGGLILSFWVAAAAPIQAQSKPQDTKVAPASKAPAYPDGTLLMSDESKSVYVMEKGKKVLIPDPATFNAKKYRWDQVKKVEIPVLKSIPEGKPLPSVAKKVEKKTK